MHRKLDNHFRQFLWGSKRDVAKTPLMVWNTICLLKEQVGLNFKKMKDINKALLIMIV